MWLGCVVDCAVCVGGAVCVVCVFWSMAGSVKAWCSYGVGWWNSQK